MVLKPANMITTAVKINIIVITSTVFNMPLSGITQNNPTEMQEVRKKTDVVGNSTLRAYNAKGNETIRPTIITLQISANTATTI